MPRLARLAAAFALLLGLLAALPAATALAAVSMAKRCRNVPFGQFTTSINFNTGRGRALSASPPTGGGGPFAGATPAAASLAPFIQSGSYLFTLHAGGDCTGAPLHCVRCTS